MLTTTLDLLGLAAAVAALLVGAFLLLGAWGLVGGLAVVAAAAIGGSWVIDRVRQ